MNSEHEAITCGIGPLGYIAGAIQVEAVGRAMHPELIKAEIRMKGSSPAVIATELGISKATVSHVIYGRGVSARVANRIAEITGLSVGVLWPSKKTVLRRAGRPATSAAA